MTMWFWIAMAACGGANEPPLPGPDGGAGSVDRGVDVALVSSSLAIRGTDPATTFVSSAIELRFTLGAGVEGERAFGVSGANIMVGSGEAGILAYVDPADATLGPGETRAVSYSIDGARSFTIFDSRAKLCDSGAPRSLVVFYQERDPATGRIAARRVTGPLDDVRCE